MLWVITRSQPEADADAAALRALGLTARALPCIERVPLPWPQQWAPASRALVLVSSPFAAGELIKAWPRLSAPKVAAMAPHTAARLEAAAIPVEVRAQGGVVALAQALQRWHHANPGPLAILYATSDAGMKQPEQLEAVGILSQFAQVDRVPVYSTRAPAGLDQALAALEPRAGLVFFSPSAVEAAFASLSRLGRPFSVAAVACIGQSTLRRYAQLAPAPAATHYSTFTALCDALGRENPP